MQKISRRSQLSKVGEGGTQRLEPQALEITRHQTTLSGVDISQSPKAVVLQSEDVIRIVERLLDEP